MTGSHNGGRQGQWIRNTFFMWLCIHHFKAWTKRPSCADDIFKCIFMNEKFVFWLKFVLKCPINFIEVFFPKGSTISQHWFRKWPGAWINNYSVHWRTLTSAEPKALKGLIYNSVNLSRPGDAYMHQQTWSSLVEILVWRLFGAMPLSEPVQALLLIGPLGTFFLIF